MRVSHRIRVFVFRIREGAPDYLLLKPDQGLEGLWGPLSSDLGFGDKLETAIRSQVLDDTGMCPPGEVIDLDMQARWSILDEEVIEWTFGYQPTGHPKPDLLGSRFGDYRWTNFGLAYPKLGLEIDRAAILRLHSKLGAA